MGFSRKKRHYVRQLEKNTVNFFIGLSYNCNMAWGGHIGFLPKKKHEWGFKMLE